MTIHQIFSGVTAVLFDLDGTLVDSNEQQAQSWVDVFAEHGYTVDLFLVRSLMGLGREQLVYKAIGEVSETVFQTMEKRKSEILLEKYLYDVIAIDKAPELIVLLKNKGLSVILATAAARQERTALLKRADLLDHFLEKVDLDLVESSKPAPDIYLACLSNHEFEPAHCLVIADTPYDGEAAYRAGMKFLGVETGGYSAERLPTADAVFASLTALYNAMVV